MWVFYIIMVHFIGLMRLVTICNGPKTDITSSTMSKKVKRRKTRGR